MAYYKNSDTNVKHNSDGTDTYTVWCHDVTKKAQKDGHEYKELTGFVIADGVFVKMRRIVGASSRENKVYGEEWAYDITIGKARSRNGGNR